MYSSHVITWEKNKVEFSLLRANHQLVFSVIIICVFIDDVREIDTCFYLSSVVKILV